MESVMLVIIIRRLEAKDTLMGPTNKAFGESKDDLFVAFDGHALFYRSFHAMPSMSGPTGE
jgi:hypothetical protein